MSTYAKYGSKSATPQTEPLKGMVKNSAGGYSYKLSKWDVLDRFLILGSEGGTYYIKEQKLTKKNAKNIIKLIKEDGKRVVDRIVTISDEGRAPKNTPALFALALASVEGDENTRYWAYRALPKVARTGYHWYMWATYTKNLGGTGMGWRKAVGRLFNELPPDKLAYQAVKYQQREGWTMGDLLRLSHPKPRTPKHDLVYRWVLGKETEIEVLPQIIYGYEKAKQARDVKDVVTLIEQYNLPREAIPTQFLNEKEVWQALLPKMPLTALIRNLGKMTKIGLVAPLTRELDTVLGKLESTEYIHRSRVHPLNVLVALKTYAQGKGMRGSLSWTPVQQVVDALDGAFYKAFANVEPSGEKYLLALDVSGSMDHPISGMPLNCREAAAAMALVTANVEKQYHIIGYTSGEMWGDGVLPLNISPRQRLDAVVQYLDDLPFGGTDTSLPFIYAAEKNLEVDKFISYTDNETWAGERHASVRLNEYRSRFVTGAKSIVVGMTATRFTIADPNDPLSLDVVGFDTSVPQVISQF